MNLKSFYHGTINVYSERIMQSIELSAGRFFTDFGQGFYVTDNIEQAEKWAKEKWKDHIYLNEGVLPSVIVVEINQDMLNTCNGLLFRESNNKWADFVLNCRKRSFITLNDLQFDMLDLDFIMDVRRILEGYLPGKTDEVLFESVFLCRLSKDPDYVYHYDAEYWADFVYKEYKARQCMTA